MAKKSKGKNKSVAKKSSNESQPINLTTSIIFAMIVQIILSIIVLVIFTGAFLWIQKLEKMNCKCSEDWKRDFIKVYLYYILGMFIVNLILAVLFNTNIRFFLYNNLPRFIFTFIQIFIFAFGIINIIVSITYINDLKVNRCECSESEWREIYYYYNIFSILYILALFLVLSMAIITGFVIFAKN